MNPITSADPESKSADILAGNISLLKSLFPELITEGPSGAAVNVDESANEVYYGKPTSATAALNSAATSAQIKPLIAEINKLIREAK